MLQTTLEPDFGRPVSPQPWMFDDWWTLYYSEFVMREPHFLMLVHTCLEIAVISAVPQAVHAGVYMN